jgi:YggT family protein
MFGQIAQYLIEVAAGFIVVLLLARLLMQGLRISLRNPFGEFVVAATHWLVAPMRRVIPPFGALDLATLCAAWLVQLAALWLLQSLGGAASAAGAGVAAAVLAALAALDLARYALYLLTFALVVQVVLSWINPYSPVAPAVDAVTRPLLRPIRRRLPPMGGIDLSPMILFVALQVLLIPLAHLRAQVGALA